MSHDVLPSKLNLHKILGLCVSDKSEDRIQPVNSFNPIQY